MKNVFLLLVVLFFLTGCERNEPEPNPNADWKVLEIPTDINLNKVFFVNEQTGFVAGTYKFQKLRVNISSGRNESYWWYISNVHIITDSTSYFHRTIETVPEVPEPSFFKTTDGGNSWESLSGPFVSRVTDIFFLDESYGFVTTSEEGVYKTTDGGKNWQKILANVFFAGGQFIIENPYSKVYFINKKEGFAFSEEKNIVIKTNDGGESWSHVSSFVYTDFSSSDISNIVFPDKTTIGYAFKRNDSFLSKTEDGGETWERMVYKFIPDFGVNSYFPVDDFSFLSEGAGYFVSSGVVYSTTDGGLNWEQKPSSGTRASLADKIQALNENDLFLLDGENRMIWYSGNGGESFNEMSLEIRNIAIRDWIFTKNAGYVVGENGLMMKYDIKK